jgi:glycosyltransferase involved in cell wall biosynthesis
MARALVAGGHAVEVVTLSERLDHTDNEWPFQIWRVPRHRPLLWRALQALVTIWRRARFADVVFINGLSSAAQLAALMARRPSVHKVVGDYAWERAQNYGWYGGSIDEYQSTRHGWRLKLLNAERSWAVRRASKVIVPSDYLARIVTGWGVESRRIQRVYNAVDMHGRVGVSAPTAGLTLITVCRLVAWKGVSGLIDLMRDLPRAKLIVVGDGPLRSTLEARAADLGVEARVYFVGDVPASQVRDYLARAQIFVLNSSYEGLPHVVLEAMAVGIPVVATDAGGTCELVVHRRTGVLVAVGNVDALRHAVVELSGDGALRARLVEEAGLMLARRFSLEAMIRETEDVLSRASIESRAAPIRSDQ